MWWTKTARAAGRRASRPMLALVLVVLAAACLPGWRQQATTDGVFLEDIACVDAQHCWAVGSTGADGATAAVTATSDGSTWAPQAAGVTGPGLRAVACWTGGRCVAVGRASVLRTTDGGVTWTALPAPWAGTVDLADVSCTDAGRCVAAGSDGSDGVLVTSADGGATWSVVAAGVLATAPLAAVDCTDGRCLAVGSARAGQVLWSADGGVTWAARAPLGTPPGPPYTGYGTTLAAVDCVAGGACVVTGGSRDRYYGTRALVWRTTDWGATWSTAWISPGATMSPAAASCADAEHCWVGGSSSAPTPIWATGAASDRRIDWYGQFSGIDGAHTVTGLACLDTDRCKATVTTPAGSRLIDTTDGGNSVPAVTGITPEHGPSAGGTAVSLAGHGFTGATAVRFGAADATAVTVLDDDHLVATAPAGDPASPEVTVSVVTPDGAGAAPLKFLYDFPLHLTMDPDRCAFGPETYCDDVWFTGTGIPPNVDHPDAIRVRVGTIPVNIQCYNTTQCGAGVPSAREHPELINSTVPVTFETAGGTQSFAFTYGPVVDGIAPTDGPTAGWPLTITGRGLAGVTAVRFGGVPVPFTVVDDTRITTATPPGVGDTDVALSITNALGDFAIAAADVSYRRPPVITRLIPSSGPVGDVIQIQGEHLPSSRQEPRAVWFGDVRLPDPGPCDEENCFADVPPGTGTVPVRIETGGGISPVTPDAMFTYTDG